jgi:BCD family chlorophyll transporter-like MFS transporter
MLLVAVLGSLLARRRAGSLRAWTIGGCLASGLALAALALGGFVGPTWPLRGSVFVLGLANGAFAVAAIASMMALAGTGQQRREGVRMGLWGAAQAIAFGVGGFLGTVAIDITRQALDSVEAAYATVFLGEAVLFVAAAWLAARVGRTAEHGLPRGLTLPDNAYAAETAQR